MKRFKNFCLALLSLFLIFFGGHWLIGILQMKATSKYNPLIIIGNALTRKQSKTEQGNNSLHRNRTSFAAPKNQLVFIKTHKTASSTIASIFARYGYAHKLSFLLPPHSHKFDALKTFRREMARNSPPPFKNSSKYNILANHARYDRKEIDYLIPNATYITILREPVAHFESNFGYFQYRKSLSGVKCDPTKSDLENFVDIIAKSESDLIPTRQGWQQRRNGQIFDLGFEVNQFENTFEIHEKIARLDSEFDLILIMEYLDQSLLVMKKLLNWGWKDIVYFSHRIRLPGLRTTVGQTLRLKISQWNFADLLLYDHFNQTLWKKIGQYGDGDTFKRDLQKFRNQLKYYSNKCLKEKIDLVSNKKEKKFVIKNKNMKICELLLKGEVDYTRLLSSRQRKKNNNFYFKRNSFKLQYFASNVSSF